MRHRILIALWLAADALLFIGSYALAYFLRVGWILSTDFPLYPYLAAVCMAAPLWLLLLIGRRTFSISRSQGTVRNILFLSEASVVGAALFTLGYYMLYGLFFSRLLLLLALVLSTLSIVAWHLLFERILRVTLRKPPPAFPTLLIGMTRELQRLLVSLARRRHPLMPVGILVPGGTAERSVHGVPVLGKLDKLETTLDRLHITHLIQGSDIEQSLNLLSACRERGITYLLLPSVLGIIERDERIDSLEGHAVVAVSPRRKWWERVFG